MKLTDYISGSRKGREAHLIEREAMSDPFLADALEGYDALPGDHADAIARMQGQVTRRSRRKRILTVRTLSIAASLLFCIALGGYLWIGHREQQPQLALSSAEKEDTMLPPSLKPSESEHIAQAEKSVPVTEEKRHNITTHVFSDDSQRDYKVADLADEMIASAEIIAVPEEGAVAQKDMTANLDTAGIEEVVAVGFGTQKKVSITGIDTSGILMARAATPVAAVAQASYKSAEKMSGLPVPVGGMDAYRKYLKENMKRPTEGECAAAKGTVTLRFSSDAMGTPVDIEIIKSLCSACDDEAVRLVKEGPKWTPSLGSIEIDVEF